MSTSGYDRVRAVVSRVKYRDWLFQIREPHYSGCLLSATFNAPEYPSGKMQLQETREWWVSYEASDDEIVRTCLKLVLTAEEHEAREWFLYCEKQVYGPHESP